MIGRAPARFLVALILTLGVIPPHAAQSQPAQTLKATSRPSAPAPISFQEETLDNGLRVIYAPLHQTPVVHVRVIYHVGSRDERPDRQGFAHMFEHMMFRGSAHVKPEEHMKLIGIVGGISNAFTSFDQTVYHDTIPSNQLDLALYLEADRMASFKVDENIYKTERKVVAEEWRMKQNRPYGNQYEDFMKNAFTSHSYRWTPIGNMDHLRAADVAELQDFFNTYYLPNNAILVISGDIDVEAARKAVKRYFKRIPAGEQPGREIPKEPEQNEARQAEVAYHVPLPAVMIGYHLPQYKSEDHYAMSLLSSILSGGHSSRLDRLLVNSESPQAVDVYANHMPLEDAGLFIVGATVMQGRAPPGVEQKLTEAIADICGRPVSDEELEKAKTAERIGLLHGRETANSLAVQLGDEALFGDDANRVNTALAKLQALTAQDIQRVARKYLEPNRATVLRVKPDPLGKAARAATTQASMETPVAPATRPVTARSVTFPPEYPASPSVAQTLANPKFEKGTELNVAGVRVIVMPDARLPLVNWSLTMRRGSHSDPKGQEGLAWLTGNMVRRGVKGLSYDQLNEDLESRGISIEVSDGGDFTRLAGSSTTEQLQHALQRARQLLREPTFPEAEFRKLKEQKINELSLSRESPSYVASQDLDAALFGDSPLGVQPTPESVSAISLGDVKHFYGSSYRPNEAILVLAGDVTLEKGKELAGQLLEGWESGRELPAADYHLPAAPAKRHIIVVDRPGGKQSTVRMGVRAYDISDDIKFAGSIAGQILTAGIDSRLGRYVRAEKGLAYGVHGVFQPGRHGGAFIAATDTAVESTADAIEAMFKVFNDMRGADVTAAELSESKTRVAGGMVMGMQTIQQQAGYRVDGILNNYPIDYYDKYPARIGEVTAEQVHEVMNRYVKDGEMVIVVVAPAEAVRGQLERLGEVEVVPMPAQRKGAAPTTQELVKPAAVGAGFKPARMRASRTRPIRWQRV